MTQIELNDSGDLRLVFQEYDETDNVIVYKLSNDSEIEFVDDECVGIVLPSFEQKLDIGHISRDTLSLQDYWLEDDTVFINVDVDVYTGIEYVHETVHVKTNLSSLKDKI